MPYTEETDFLTSEEFNRSYELFYGFQARWTYTGFSNEKSVEQRFWFFPLDDHPFFHDILQTRIRERHPELGPLEKVYANGQTSLQGGDWHIDRPQGTTFLWYLHSMQPNWGGRTMFFHMNEESAYTPKSNSIIRFPANIPHKGEAPTVECPVLRVSVAWKFE